MHKDIAVKLQNISKVYKLYDKPIDRLKESLHPFKKKYHKDFYALKNINLEIKKGEVLGIVGVNGAGKSTLLKIIAGVLTPTHGRVIINGRINAILELSSGLKPEMTGRENIKLNLQINGIYNNLENLTSEIIEFADIGEHIDQPVKSYSSGMKARLGFGLATSTDPDILIVDEVLAVGDVLFQRKCFTRIENLFKNGKTVIFVSHNAQSVVEFCSHAILLYDREIILEDTPKKVTDYYQKLVFSKDHTQVLNELHRGETSVVKKTTQTDEVIKKVDEKTEFNKDIINKAKPLQNTKNTNAIKGEKQEELKKEQPVEDTTMAYYIPDLKPTTTLEYKDYDVKIHDLCIIDKNNSLVNVLVSGQTYSYQYKVKFEISAENVSFGMLIKNEKGITISSSSLSQFDNEITFIGSGETYTISWKFTCMLNPGMYYLNAGASSSINQERVFLHRIVDALCIKVISKYPKRYGGIVHFNQIPSTRVLNDKSSI